MSKLFYEGNSYCSGPSTSSARARIGSVGSVALLTLLAGCAQSNAPGQIFDYASVTSTAAPPSGRTTGQREHPRAKPATAVLGTLQAGPGYTVESNARSDGRYSTYVFATEFGTYPVTGDDLARNHLQELVALDALKKQSLSGEFVHGAGNAVLSPIRGVVNTVRDPIGGAQGTYRNVSRRVSSVRRGLSDAGEFVTTFGKPEKRRPERENENLLEKFVDRPKEKRRLAEALRVDPYTHFIPLSRELNKVASYSAAGSFGVNRALGFVPGGAGTVISGLGTLDSLTSRTLDMPPDETAAINRERLEKLNIPEDTIKRLLLSDKLTPTEKTRTVGFLSSIAGASGLEALASFIASSETRVGAFTAMQTLCLSLGASLWQRICQRRGNHRPYPGHFGRPEQESCSVHSRRPGLDIRERGAALEARYRAGEQQQFAGQEGNLDIGKRIRDGKTRTATSRMAGEDERLQPAGQARRRLRGRRARIRLSGLARGERSIFRIHRNRRIRTRRPRCVGDNASAMVRATADGTIARLAGASAGRSENGPARTSVAVPASLPTRRPSTPGSSKMWSTSASRALGGEQDASFANLPASCGHQTVLCQNTPIGVLLVLDLTTPKGLSGHFPTLYRAEIGDLLHDGIHARIMTPIASVASVSGAPILK